MNAATREHRIKGRGDTREVFDSEGEFVGTLVRRVGVITSGTITKTSMSFRKRKCVYWGAADTAGRALWWHDGSRRCWQELLRSWKDPALWNKLIALEGP